MCACVYNIHSIHVRSVNNVFTVWKGLTVLEGSGGVHIPLSHSRVQQSAARRYRELSCPGHVRALTGDDVDCVNYYIIILFMYVLYLHAAKTKSQLCRDQRDFNKHIRIQTYCIHTRKHTHVR